MATSQRWRWPHEKRTKICSPAGWCTGELLMTVWWNGRESGSQWSLFVPKWSKWMDQIREKLFPSLHCGVVIVGPAGSAAAKFQLSRMLLVLSARFFDYILRRRRHNHQLTAAVFPIVSSAFLLLRGSLLQAEQSTYRKTKRSCQRMVKVEQTTTMTTMTTRSEWPWICCMCVSVYVATSVLGWVVCALFPSPMSLQEVLQFSPQEPNKSLERDHQLPKRGKQPPLASLEAAVSKKVHSLPKS